MSSFTVDIQGFDELERLIKRLPDKVKKRELNKIFRQVANPTKNAAKNYAPQYGLNGPYVNRTLAKKRQIGKTVIDKNYVPGKAKKLIKVKALRKTSNAIVSVGAHGAEAFYVRHWVIADRYGRYQGNPFIDRAYDLTKGRVTDDAKDKVARYLQKQINRLSNA